MLCTGLPTTISTPGEGDKVYYPELDLRLMTMALIFQGSVQLLTLKNLTLVNLPQDQRFFPVGLVSTLPWFVGFYP